VARPAVGFALKQLQTAALLWAESAALAEQVRLNGRIAGLNRSHIAG
jgi:hypothetical protein